MDNNKYAIFVDFDECLIHGFTASDRKTPTFDEVKKDFEVTWIADEETKYVIVLRPGAKEFLQELKKITPNIFILTAGLKDFQIKVAESAGLFGLVKGLYGRDSTDVPKFTCPILIDDMWLKSGNTFRKCQQMGIIDRETQERIDHGPWVDGDEDAVAALIEKHYIQIRHFDATDKNDAGFQEVMPKIQPKLDVLSHEFRDYLKEKIIAVFKEGKAKI